MILESKISNQKHYKTDTFLFSGNINRSRGFSLVELLIVVALLSSILAIVVGVATTTLRGSNKSSVVISVREEGNYAISQISRTIKFAKTLDGASVDGNPPWTCQLMPFPTSPTPTPVFYKAVRVTAFNGLVTTFSCNDASDTPPETIVSNNNSLLDTNSVILTAPIPSTCYFTCTQERITDSPNVGVYFMLESKTSSTLFESQASMPFSTQIKLRN